MLADLKSHGVGNPPVLTSKPSLKSLEQFLEDALELGGPSAQRAEAEGSALAMNPPLPPPPSPLPPSPSSPPKAQKFTLKVIQYRRQLFVITFLHVFYSLILLAIIDRLV
jgi:hypothetical protein